MNTAQTRAVPRIIAAGDTATLTLELADPMGKRLADVAAGTATVTLRRERHELAHLPAELDPETATVTLDLSAEHTTALAPPYHDWLRGQQAVAAGSVRVAQGSDVGTYGPFSITLSSPETDQAVPTPGPST